MNRAQSLIENIIESNATDPYNARDIVPTHKKSRRHILRQFGSSWRCDRCGAIGNGIGFLCSPTPKWLAAHPSDDRGE